jgi:hypothetical protein
MVPPRSSLADDEGGERIGGQPAIATAPRRNSSAIVSTERR